LLGFGGSAIGAPLGGLLARTSGPTAPFWLAFGSMVLLTIAAWRLLAVARLPAMAEVLDEGQIATALTTLDGWHAGDHEIVRTVECPSFPAAIAVVDQVAVVAEEMDHHPDIDIRWRTLTFRCSTHSAGGVTARDLRLAQRINELVSESAAAGPA
jgi:4a-hydroxytetrahydrobiopterin dehydratase